MVTVTRGVMTVLRLKLSQCIGEIAAASDLSTAQRKLDAVLEGLTVVDDEAETVSLEDAKGMVDEIERRGQVIAELQETNAAQAEIIANAGTIVAAHEVTIAETKAAIAAHEATITDLEQQLTAPATESNADAAARDTNGATGARA